MCRKSLTSGRVIKEQKGYPESWVLYTGSPSVYWEKRGPGRKHPFDQTNCITELPMPLPHWCWQVLASRKGNNGPGLQPWWWHWWPFPWLPGLWGLTVMPIRVLCTISRDVAAIHCGHTFHLHFLNQWFETAPSRTCPQCRIQVSLLVWDRIIQRCDFLARE